ncbi:MAG: hypothetical protein DRO15_05780 [Thermoprotei archaeon]|nr:MAG: hypothetical protein DRO15_05780 [Thermoprotei archaeon]
MNGLPEKYRKNTNLLLLSLLNSLGAINEERAVSIKDIMEFLDIRREIVLEFLNELIRRGYVAKKNGKYFITRTGIRVVMGLIS